MRKKYQYLLCLAIMIFMTIMSMSIAFAKPPQDLLEDWVNNKKLALEKQNDANVWFSYAMSCAYTGKLEEGLDALKKVDAIEPSYARKIKPVLKKKVLETPDYWKGRFYYAFAVYAMTIDKKKYKLTTEESLSYQEESIEQFKAIVKLLGERSYVTAWSYGYISAILGEQGKFLEGIPLLKKAIKIEPDGVYLHIALGYAYLKTGNYLGLISESLIVGRLKADEKNNGQDDVTNDAP